MAIEREYNVPLRKEFMKAPRHQRAKKAVGALRQFLLRHMKTDQISLGKHLNEKIWERGIKNPPHHVKVQAKKSDDGKVKAELLGYALEEKVDKKETKVKKEKVEAKEEKKKAKEEQPQKETKEAEKPADSSKA